MNGKYPLVNLPSYGTWPGYKWFSYCNSGDCLQLTLKFPEPPRNWVPQWGSHLEHKKIGVLPQLTEPGSYQTGVGLESEPPIDQPSLGVYSGKTALPWRLSWLVNLMVSRHWTRRCHRRCHPANRSMDWFRGKSQPETLDFPMTCGAFRLEFSQQNQSIE